MQRLKSSEHIYFTDSILRILTQNRISTILDFLQEDTEKLCTLTKLSLPQVLDVRNNILKKYSAPLINGSSILVDNITKKKFISTGITCLDYLLGGGIPTGYITEICGLAESGKTQLCLQLAINCVKNTENSVLYVDSKGDFSANRMQKILDATGHSYKEMAQIMFRVRVVNVWTMDDILELFKKLKNQALVVKNLSLIIIDSLPCLMFQHLGDENKVGLTFLNMLVNYSRFLSKELNIGIIFINIQTRWLEQDIFDIDAPGVSQTNFSEDGETSIPTEPNTEKRNRCLGKYWQHIPAFLLILEKLQNINPTENLTEVSVTLARSLGIKSDRNCTLKINYGGVT